MKETVDFNIWQKKKLLQMLIRLAIGEESDNELDEPQESMIKKILSSTRDGTNVVINYVGSSTNQELQAY